MNKFFIMTRGRTGSTAIIDELNKVNGVRAAQELFIKKDFTNDMKRHGFEKLCVLHNSMMPFELWKAGTRRRWYERWLISDAPLNRYLDKVESVASEEGCEAFGFKALSHHFQDTPRLDQSLCERGYQAIYLKRNIPRQVISGMVAKQRGIYNTKKTYQDESRYRIDVKNFQKRVRREIQAVDGDLAFLESTGFNCLEVTYEEFMANRKEFFERVLGFIGVSEELPQASAYTVMIKDLEHTVENYQMVSDCAAAMGIRIE